MTSSHTPSPTNFVDLPAELRNQIWILVLSNSGSAIKLSVKCLPIATPPPGWRTLTRPLRTIPSLLSVNRESRALALVYYIKGFKMVRYWKYIGGSYGQYVEEQRRAVDGAGVHGFLNRCKRVWAGGEWGRVDSVSCVHETDLRAAFETLYWDPDHDWIVVEQSNEQDCDVNARCRGVHFTVITWFDSRAKKIVMRDCVRKDFRDQNRHTSLVAFGAFRARHPMVSLGEGESEWMMETEDWSA